RPSKRSFRGYSYFGITTGSLDLLGDGLYFGFDGQLIKFPAQIHDIDVLRRALEVLYYFK
ncbi:20941_t:CDS:2, partial [Gigaspora rosea]